MQKELDGMASSRSAFGAINPVAWISAAAHILMAAIRAPEAAAAASPTPDTPMPSVMDRGRAGVAPIAPSSRYARTERAAGWGKNPFRPPAPPLGPSSTATPSPPAGIPPVSAADLQTAIDQDAFFYLYSLPEKGGSSAGIADYDEKGGRMIVGFNLSETLHRFDVNVSAPTNRAPLAARFKLGESVGTCTWRWMMMPPDLVLAPGVDPPVWKMDADAAQQFAMRDGLFRFGNGEDGFYAMGAGQTFPAVVRGRKQLHITAIGILADGFGRFKDRQSGVFVYSGTINASGFRGTVMLRVNDVEGTLRTSEPLPVLEPSASPEHGVTWLTLHGQATPSMQPVSFPPVADQPGVIFRQDLRLIDMDFTTRVGHGIKCTTAIRQVVGSVTSRVAFDVAIGDGTAGDPMPFAVWREFSFVDFLGKPVGGFTTESTDGNAVYSEAGGVRGIRFVSAGRIVSGTGRFEGMSALLCENTFTVLDPYAGSSVYTLRVEDPTGSFFAHAGIWRDIPEAEIRQKKK